jgi:DNA-binding XRE family transcriptional regulator
LRAGSDVRREHALGEIVEEDDDLHGAAEAAATFLVQLAPAARARGERSGRPRRSLAKRAKITREYVNKLEAGRYDPTMGTLQALAKALGVPVTELLEG